MTTDRNDRQAQLDRAVLDALADGQPHTGDDVQKATAAASAHVMSSLRRLAIEDKVVFTSEMGKRVYVRPDIDGGGATEDRSPEAPAEEE